MNKKFKYKIKLLIKPKIKYINIFKYFQVSMNINSVKTNKFSFHICLMNNKITISFKSNE